MANVNSGISFAEPNNLELWGADAGHAYNPQAPTRETLYTLDGHECWHNKFYEMLHKMGFKLSATAPGTYMGYSKDGSHHEYIAVFVDDLAIYMKDQKPFCDLGCGHTRNEGNTTNTLSQHLKYASLYFSGREIQMTSMPRQRGVTEFQPQRALSNLNPNG